MEYIPISIVPMVYAYNIDRAQFLQMKSPEQVKLYISNIDFQEKTNYEFTHIVMLI